jgi:sec-independent protein translocase protein TatC
MKLFEKKEHDLNKAEMPFLDHLEELRWRIIKSLIAIVAFTLITFFFSDFLLQLLLKPGRQMDPPLQLQVLKVQTSFMVKLQIALVAGIVFSFPVIFYQIWQFVSPGLLRNEKAIVPALAASTVVCFGIGAVFAYLIIIPYALDFFREITYEGIEYKISLDYYLGFVLRIIIIFGVVFELPMLSYVLSKIGVLTPRFMRKYRRYAIVIIFIIAAILTPPDPMTQLFLAIPLVLLYEFSIFISYIFSPKEKKSAAQK